MSDAEHSTEMEVFTHEEISGPAADEALAAAPVALAKDAAKDRGMTIVRE